VKRSVVMVWVIARLTLAEAARRRLFLALVALTVVSVALSAWGFAQIASFAPPGADAAQAAASRSFVVSQFLVLVTFMYSFILALGAAFMAAPIVAADLESGVALTMLARPLRRSELLLGKWLGIAILIAAYAVGSGLAELAAVRLTTDYLPPDPLLAVGFLVGEALVLLTLATALATRLAAITAGVTALAIFGLAWIGGIVGGIGIALGNRDVALVGDITRLLIPTDGLWRGTAFHLYPSVVIEIYRQAGPAGAAFPFYVVDGVALWYVAWAVLWVAVVLGLGLLSFRIRDL
jgi:ABC-type transport system involved in multi-copper enzyme maturation permease subunit